jgi:DNA mismatch repair ATPase MutS
MDPTSNQPDCDKWRLRLIVTMLTWASSPDALEIMGFCIRYRISRETLHNWAKEYEDIARALEEMKLFIAAHRRIGCMKKQLDNHSAFRNIHLLDPEEDAVNRYHADLKKKNELEEQVRYLVEIVRPKIIDRVDTIKEISA